MEKKTPRQFDWLKAHLAFYDDLAPGSKHGVVSQEYWEKMVGDAIDRYVVESSSFMSREIPIAYLSHGEK